jgi:hypothetical protein
MSWPKDGAKTLNWRFRIAGDPEATLSSIPALTLAGENQPF